MKTVYFRGLYYRMTDDEAAEKVKTGEAVYVPKRLYKEQEQRVREQVGEL